MCGRYASSRSPEDLVEEFEVLDPRLDHVVPPSYNVAPTDEVYAVMERSVKDADGRPSEEVVRQLRVLRWGLIPSWVKEEKIGSRMINARMETVAEKPAFRNAFTSRRCILPADGYFEWYESQKLPATGRSPKGGAGSNPSSSRPVTAPRSPWPGSMRSGGTRGSRTRMRRAGSAGPAR